MSCSTLSLLHSPKKIIVREKYVEFEKSSNIFHYQKDKNEHQDGFKIKISKSGIYISYGKRNGLKYAKQTLLSFFQKYLIDNNNTFSIPSLTIYDKPDFEERGFMLDVSRGRVPKISEIFELIELLSKLRYTELQLYIEHTFAFKSHKTVWQGASPFTDIEIKKIDKYCQEYGIRLVPNLNSFGHVERWLKHKKYKHLAECPNGFYHELFKSNRIAGTFAATNESVEFMKNLYTEFLPCFSEKIFNIGGDEPWELGQGKSKGLCKKIGKDKVYLQHLRKLQIAASEQKKQIQFWADILLDKNSRESAERRCILRGHEKTIDKISTPASIPVIWGYEANHPFSKQCRQVSKETKSFYVAPGTSAWLSLCGRWSNAKKNIISASKNGKKSGAKGMLLTTWGDFGYHNSFHCNLLPLFATAALSWNTNVDLDNVLDFSIQDFLFFSKKESQKFIKVLKTSADIDLCFKKQITNRSITREFFFCPKSDFLKLINGVNQKEIKSAQSKILNCQKQLSTINTDNLILIIKKYNLTELTNHYLSQVSYIKELDLALEMIYCGLERANAALTLNKKELAKIEKHISKTFPEKFSKIWTLRNRIGGLKESLRYFNLEK